MSYGKIYETTYWVILPEYIFLGFNKTLAFISQSARFFISTIKVTIDTILETIDRTNY